MSKQELKYSAQPSALSYMLKALLPSRGFDSAAGFPGLVMTWKGFRFESRALETLAKIAGGGSPFDVSNLLLLPHITGFRLLMAMVTHPAWPLPIWRALQVRNRLTLYRMPEPAESFELNVSASAWRVLEKGLEVDLQSKLRGAGDLVWESVVTFYYRGRYGQINENGAVPGTPRNQPDLSNLNDGVSQWRVDGGHRWTFGALTGDYNGIHQWNWYARRLGFQAAFAHPQRVAAQCLGRLPRLESTPQRLDLWIKGPVFFGSTVTLHVSEDTVARGSDFGLWVADDDRPALVGSHRAGFYS